MASTPNRCLLELLPPDPGRGPFRLLVELSHDDGDIDSAAGLYGGYRQQAKGNQTIHTFVQAVFCESALKAPNKPPPLDGPRLRLDLVGFIEQSNDEIPFHRARSELTIPLGAPAGFPHPARVLSLTMQPRRPGFSVGGDRPVWLEPPRRDLTVMMLRRRPELKGVVPELEPTAPAGLVLWRGSITLLRVMYEPLPPEK